MDADDGARTIDPKLDGAGLCIGIVAARFNEFFVGHLLSSCRRELRRHAVADVDVTIIWAPGSFELPVVARELIGAGSPDVVICLGCIIRGETSHYDHVAQESARGIARAALDTRTPVIYGVVTAENVEQAINRCGSKAGNRGADAALAAIAMARTVQEMEARRNSDPGSAAHRVRSDIPYFKIVQIAKRYGVSRQAVYRWLATGKLEKPRTHPMDGSEYWLESDLPPMGT